jgi:hypothetical protein
VDEVLSSFEARADVSEPQSSRLKP